MTGRLIHGVLDALRWAIDAVTWPLVEQGWNVVVMWVVGGG